MLKEITYKEYWEEIESLVEMISNEYDLTEVDLYDAIHEVIDSHEWIIYNYYNLQVLEHSDNKDYMFEQGLADLSNASTIADVLNPCAYWAMYADVSEKANELGLSDASDSSLGLGE